MVSSILSGATLTTKRLAIADQLLYGFDIQDGQSREFLRQAIASGQSPPEAIKELQDIALMRGNEEFTMVLQCADALARQKKKTNKAKRRSKHTSSSLSSTDTKKTAKHTSHFWDGGEDMHDAASSAGIANTSSFKAFVEFDKLANKLREDLSASTTSIKAVDFERFDELVEELKEDLEASSKALRPSSSGRQAVAASKQAPMPVPSIPGRSLREKTPTVVRQTSIPVPMIPDNGIGNDRPHHSHCHPTLSPNDSPQSKDLALTYPNLAPPPPPKNLCHDPLPPRHHHIRTERAVKATRKTKTSPFFSTSPQTSNPPKPPSPSQKVVQEDQKQALLIKPSPPPTSRRHRVKPPPGVVSSLPISTLTCSRFGLIQEELAHSPFYLLVAVTFLIKTTGRTAIPVFWDLIKRFPTPEGLASDENKKEVIELIKPLGLSEHRYAIIQRYARGFVENPPTKDKRFGVKNYPLVGDGRDVTAGEVFGAEDLVNGSVHLKGAPSELDVIDMVKDQKERAIGQAWEIGHLTQGVYTLDSWRIFCRDVLLGRAEDWTGKGGRGGECFQPEWMRVLPRDKELRACLRWMWMREGWAWDPVTGDREPLREELRKAVDEGRVGYDDNGSLVILKSESSTEIIQQAAV